MARELIGVEVARELVLEHAGTLGREDVALEDALGRTLAGDVASAEAVPGFDNSAMDGFAVRSSDTRGATADAPILMRTIDESRAGHPAQQPLAPGEAIAISTGAMLPRGADAVIPIEDTRSSPAGIVVGAEVEAGRYVRRTGEDVRAGDVVLRAGDVVGPSELGVLAAVGRSQASCVRRPLVRVLTTGDELLDPREPSRPGFIRDANALTVPTLARLAGAELAGVERVGDSPQATAKGVRDALDSDVAVICGGVSVGEHDHVRAALEDAGAREVFWGVALRPGRPTWFGTRGVERRAAETLVFGLPGNPVSSIVTFLFFVRPAIRALCGADLARDRLTAVLDDDYRKARGRSHALRCRLALRDDGWHATLTGAQGSHVLTSMLGADGLAIVPSASEGVAAGERLEVELLPRSV